MHWLSKKNQLTQPIPEEEESICHTRLSTLIQKTNQKVYKHIQYGKAGFSESLDVKKKQRPFHLDMTRFNGNIQQYKTLNRIVTSIQNNSEYYSERLKTEQLNIKAKINLIDKNIRNIRSSIEQQKKMKKQIQKEKRNQAKEFVKNIKNPQAIQSNYNFKKQLKNKSKSQGMLKIFNKNQSDQINPRIKTERAFSNSQKKLSNVLKENIEERSEYINRIKSILNSKGTQLPPIFKQKCKPLSGISKKSSQSQVVKIKNIPNQKIDQAMEQIIFKKLSNNPQPFVIKSPRRTKQKYQRIQDGNKMLKQSLKRVKTKQQLEISEEKERIRAYKENMKKSKIIGDKYLKDSLLQIRLPLQKFIQQRHLQSLEMENYIKIAREERKKQQEQKWTILMKKIVDKEIDKYEGLIKIGTIQRKLAKLGDDPDNRLALKCSILNQHNIQ